MKKIILISAAFLILCIASIFGLKLVSNNLVNSAVNNATEAGSSKYNLPGSGQLSDCKFTGRFVNQDSETKKAIFQCQGTSGSKIQVAATLKKNGKILFIDKWRFEGFTPYASN